MVQLMPWRTWRPPRCRLRCARRTSRYRVPALLIGRIGSQPRAANGLFFVPVPMRLRLLAPRYWLTWAGLGLLRVTALLPFRLMVAVGTALGAVLRRLPTGFVKTARRNLELCFPELSPRAREQLLNRHLASLGIAVLEIPRATAARRCSAPPICTS